MDLVTLFVTGKNPDRMWHSPQQHVKWAAEPAHSYVADGSGAIVVFAHPSEKQFEQIVRLEGLVGMEVSHGGDAGAREKLWDQVLTSCVKKKRTPIWGFAADDTHSRTNIDRSWMAVRLDSLTEAACKQALRKGSFYISNGPVLGDIQVAGATITVRLPKKATVRWLRSGQYGIGKPKVSKDPGENHCLKLDAGVTESTYTLSAKDGTTDPKSALFIRCIITTDRKGEAAHSQPFVIRAADALENPYPPRGSWFKGMTHNHADTLEGSESRVASYYAAYAKKGHACAFETGYDYWVTPYLYHPPGRTPVIERIEPLRITAGVAAKVAVHGRNFSGDMKVFIDGKAVPLIKPAATQPASAPATRPTSLQFIVPATVGVGRHEITVRSANGLQDTACHALVVQTSATVNEGWTHFTPVNSELGSRHVYSVTPDSAGGVWVGTNFGLNHFDGKRWTLHRRNPETREGLLSNTVYDLAVEKSGTLWFTCFHGVGRMAGDGKLTQWHGSDAGFPSKQVNQVLRVGDTTYVTTHNRHGLFVFKDGKWRQVPVRIGDAKRLGCINGMAADAGGRIWMGTTTDGLLCWDPSKEKDAWRQFTQKNSGLPDDFVTRVAFDSKGRLWLATATPSNKSVGGLACLDAAGKKFTVYDTATSPLPERRVWALLVDREDNVWIGTSNGAACRRADGEWRIYNVSNSGLADNLVTDICQDATGSYWFATANGVSRLAPAKKPAPRP